MKETTVIPTRHFSMSAVREATRVIVRACGRLTLGDGAEHALWRSQLGAARGGEVALDLSCVTQVDARGLGVLADLAGRALQQGIRLSVVGASRATQRLAQLSRLDQAIPGNWTERSATSECLAANC
jgi:anti-anti-sigma factor